MKRLKEKQPKVINAQTHLLDKTFAMFDNGMLDMALALQTITYDNGTSKERIIFLSDFGHHSRSTDPNLTYALHTGVLNYKDFCCQRTLNHHSMLQEGYPETDIEQTWWSMVQCLRHAGIVVVTQNKSAEAD